MKVYLAGGESYYRDKTFDKINELKALGFNVNLLWSYYNAVKRAGRFCCNADSFILDSGAFSFLQSGKNLNWNEYVTQYIDFVNKYKPDYFFELDIDKIIGYDRVKEIRRRLERETGKRPIPVWHKHLGKEEFLRMCDEYDYVAIGGIVSGEIKETEYKYLPTFIREAHKHGAKVHGLGFTSSKWLHRCRFDSVDSTSWVGGTKYGQLYFFDSRRGLIKYKKIPKGCRAREDKVPMHNFTEWVKFSNWADIHL